jgi:hypothetical protein
MVKWPMAAARIAARSARLQPLVGAGEIWGIADNPRAASVPNGIRWSRGRVSHSPGARFQVGRASTLPPRFERIPGAAQAPSPSARPFWVATSRGTGTRTLTWDKTHGAWSVVVMRLDGRPGVDVTASIALRFGFLLPGAAGALLAATVLLAYALTARRRPEPAPGPGQPHAPA